MIQNDEDDGPNIMGPHNINNIHESHDDIPAYTNVNYLNKSVNEYIIREKKEKDSNKITLSYILWLFAICFATSAVQFIYAIQFALGTPLFNQTFKLLPSTITWIQSTAGPISGLIVQPLVGAISDSCKSRIGRRRPFILTGAILCTISLIIIAYSPKIGQHLGDHPNGTTPNDFNCGIIFAIIGFCTMNISLNMIQGPARSLISDLVDSDKQHFGNAMVTIQMGIASVAANIIGAQLSTMANSYRNIFIVGAIYCVVAVLPTMIFAKETQLKETDVDDLPTGNIGIRIFRAFTTMSREMIFISLVLFLSWFGFSPFLVSITNYFGQNVSPDNYQYGVKLGFYACAIYSVATLLLSVVVPWFINCFGEKPVYFLTHVISGVAFILLWTLNTPSVGIALLLSCAVGFSMSTFNSIPYTLMTDYANKKDAGLYMGVLNSAIVISQTISIFTSGLIEAKKNENSGWAIGYGGVITLIAAFMCFILPKRSYKVESIDEEEKDLLI